MTERVLNWAGKSIYTIAAEYESDAAAREAEANPLDESIQAYWQTAWWAEEAEIKLDKAEAEDEHPIDCTCIFCVPGA